MTLKLGQSQDCPLRPKIKESEINTKLYTLTVVKVVREDRLMGIIHVRKGFGSFSHRAFPEALVTRWLFRRVRSVKE